MTDPTPAEADIRPARGGASRLSPVWIVPILALAVTLGIAWRSYSERGVLIEIAFDSASGITEGSTELRFRDVAVGLVEKVSFSSDLSQVLVGVRVDRDLAPFLDGDAQFWVVRPEVSAQGITGLNTVLSGVYIEGRWDTTPGTQQALFEGLERPPLAGTERAGTVIQLTARDGNSIISGAPILFKGIQVGAVEAPELTENGESVVIRGFIEAPYDKIVSTNTRFWDISGVSVSLGAGGVSLNMASVASLVQGGISFDTLVSGGEPIEPGHTFPLYGDQAAARASLLDDPSADSLRVKAVFDGEVGGLTEGAMVRFRGLEVGQVSGVAMVAEEDGNRAVVRLHATLAINPARLGLGEDAEEDDALALLDSYVEQGLRVRLATSSLLSSALVVDMVELPDPDPAKIVTAEGALPVLPTVPAEVADLNASAESVFKRINDLPVEELLASVQGLVDSANRLISSDDALGIAPEINATLAELRELRPTLTSTLAETEATLAEVRAIAAELRESGTAETVNQVFDSAAAAADAVEAAAAELPKLTTRVNALAARTELVLQAYDDNSRLVSNALSTLRSISEAADSLRSFARQLQRNPNSLLMGR